MDSIDKSILPAEKVRTWGATLTRKPRMPAGRHFRWEGDWVLGEGGTYNGKWSRGMIWTRDRLELDGHEDCCHHVWPVFVRVGEWVEDPDDTALIDGQVCGG